MTKITVNTLLSKKQNNEKIAALTAYDYSMARLLDKAGVDIILVGDSLGMVVLGYLDTTKVTMDDMIHHTKAVSRGTEYAMIVGDMPFLSCSVGINDAVKNAGRFIAEANANAVKIEGGSEVCPIIEAIINSGIPVMGHLGLTPQSVNVFGGYILQGKTLAKAKKLIEDALALQDVGVFAIVLECIPSELAQIITDKLSIPTIGIGAGSGASGQVLVIHDMLSLYDKLSPKFVKQYADLSAVITNAVSSYINEVKSGTFPEKQHSYRMEKEVLEKLRELEV